MEISNTTVNAPQSSHPTPGAQHTLTITCEKLSKRFNREWIFKNFDYPFVSGNTYVITGPNGSGKSTLLQILWGQVPQTSGTLQYNKNNVSIPGEEIWQHVAIAAPYMDLIDEFTLEEQLRFHFRLKKARDMMPVDNMLERMYLTEARDKTIANFSSGMRQRVKLALAFFTDADLVFLDEPSTNLDQQAFSWYKKELARLPAHAMVFIASNNHEEYPREAKALNLMDWKAKPA
jgi:ABC-type multidrug transport system ATPase subunit